MANPWSSFAASDYRLPQQQNSITGPANISSANPANLPNVGLPNPKISTNLAGKAVNAMGESIIEGSNLNDFRKEMGRSPKDENELKAWLNRDVTLNDKVNSLTSDLSAALAPVQEAQSAQKDNQAKDDNFAANGGKKVTDPTQAAPAATLSDINSNTINGVEPPKPTEVKLPDVDSQINQLLQDNGKKVAFDENKVPQWFNSTSFNMGLINAGLTLLSGGTLAQGFAAGAGTFTQLRGRERRSAWKDDLLKAGYPAQAVEQYLDDGDDEKLEKHSPQAQQEEALQRRSNIETLRGQMYQNSPEVRGLDMQIKQGQLANQTAELGMRKQELGIRQKELDMKLGQLQASGGVDMKAVTPLVREFSTINTDNNRKTSNFREAQGTIKEIKDALAAGKPWTPELAGKYTHAQETITRGFQQGQAMVTPERAENTTNQQDWVGRKMNQLKLATGNAPTTEQLDYMASMADSGLHQRQQTMGQQAQQYYQNLMSIPGMTEEKARGLLGFSNATGYGSGVTVKTIKR